MSLLSHFASRRLSKRVKEAHLTINLRNLEAHPQDWSCFYLAKQYYDECDDYNRQYGSEYMSKLCRGLEDDLKTCKDRLASEISACKPYAMDPPIELINKPSWIPVKCELYIGTKHIFHETLENLWHSGISVVYLVASKHVIHRYKHFAKEYAFGRKGRVLTVELISINAKVMSVGAVLRELAILKCVPSDFILLFWDTLLSISLLDAINMHEERKKRHSYYAMSMLYIKETSDKRLVFVLVY
ncbi:Nucleotide-diphospho-sugar transferase [Babesia duncani]|uniref:Nucleotide-diphospho-sugar transferase n=1 Tax=Babesia duncani TaxID=323732 RepID=A0AAD9PM87_9APIC|nr:Nucleotide-diphospho-sugar transferase [Babesia duncani]